MYRNDARGRLRAPRPSCRSARRCSGVRSTSTDGRERAALTFTSNQYLMQSQPAHLRPVPVGQPRACTSASSGTSSTSTSTTGSTRPTTSTPDGHIETRSRLPMTRARRLQRRTCSRLLLQPAYPLANGFKFHMAYNGGDANLSRRARRARRTAARRSSRRPRRCLRNDVQLDQPHVDPPRDELARTYATIAGRDQQQPDRRRAARAAGRPARCSRPASTPGLGVYNPNPDDDIEPADRLRADGVQRRAAAGGQGRRA